MNRSELSPADKESISILDEAFVQSLEIVLSSLSEESISIVPKDVSLKLNEAFPDSSLSIKTEYIEGFSGRDRIIFKLKDAIPFTQLAMGEQIDTGINELDDLHQSVFSEIASQVVSSTITSISGKINKKINFSFPELSVLDIPEKLTENWDSSGSIELYYSLTVGKLIESIFLYQIPKEWINYLAGKSIESKPSVTVQKELPPSPSISSKTPAYEIPVEEKVMPEKEIEETPVYTEAVSSSQKGYPVPSMQKEQTYYGSQIRERVDQEMPVVQPAKFSRLVPSGDKNVANSLDLFLDVPMKLTAVLGRAVLYLKDVMEMGSGSVFELDRLAGEPIDLMVNNKLVARGEVVVIDEKFGVRVTETLEDIQKKSRM